MQYVLLMLREVDPDPVAMCAAMSPQLLGVNSVRLSDGFTPLHCAVAGGHTDLALGLLRCGADPVVKYVSMALVERQCPSSVSSTWCSGAISSALLRLCCFDFVPGAVSQRVCHCQSRV